MTIRCMTIVAPERGNPTIWLGIGSVPKLNIQLSREYFFKLNYSVYSAITVTWH